MTDPSEPPPAPSLPDDFHELVRSGVRHRLSEWIGAAAFPVLVLGAMSGGFFWNGELLAGALFGVASIALLTLGGRQVRDRYGRRGHRWIERVTSHIAEPLDWHRVDVWFATPTTWHPRSERMVMLAQPGGEPSVMASAPRGTAGSSMPGPGWVWGRPRKGDPLVVHIDGRTLWCVGPAYGKVGIAVMRSMAKLTPLLHVGLWLDRPGHPIRSSLKPW